MVLTLPTVCVQQVVAAASYNSLKSQNASNAVVSMSTSPSYTSQNSEEEEIQANKQLQNPTGTLSNSLKFLNQAVTEGPSYDILRCTEDQVEDVKVVLRIPSILHINDHAQRLTRPAVNLLGPTGHHYGHQAWLSPSPTGFSSGLPLLQYTTTLSCHLPGMSPKPRLASLICNGLEQG